MMVPNVAKRTIESIYRKNGEDIKEVSLAMIAANNHYAGFGPGTANLFRKMVGLSELSWEDQQQIQKHLQLRQQQQKENQDHHVSNSRIVSRKQIKNRQSSLTEFID
jgi:hypothetical protein